MPIKQVGMIKLAIDVSIRIVKRKRQVCEGVRNRTYLLRVYSTILHTTDTEGFCTLASLRFNLRVYSQLPENSRKLLTCRTLLSRERQLPQRDHQICSEI